LATAMKDSKLISDKFIYEFIFNMSEDQWLQQRSDVVEDLKLRFRQNQIEQEGNDPAVTGVSFGTPHDLASIHMSSDEVEEKDKGGRPKEGIKFGQHKNEFGWDPTGKKAMDQAFRPENQKTTFQADTRAADIIKPMTRESHEILRFLKRNKQKTPNMLIESLTEKQDPTSNDSGTILDENNIL